MFQRTGPWPAAILLAGGLGLALVFASGKDVIKDPLEGKKGRGLESTPVSPPAPPEEKRVRLLESWRVPLDSPLAGPLLPWQDRVLASVESGNVQAVSLAEGSVLWKTDLGQKLAGGPVEVQGQVVQATAAGRIVALDPTEGTIRWEADLLREIRVGPTSTSDGVLAPLSSGQVAWLDAQGHERWRVDLRGEPSVPAAVCRNMVLAGTRAGTVEAFDRASGRRLWVSKTGAAVTSPMLCSRETIYFGTEDNRLRSLRLSGRRRWSYKVGGAITALPFSLGKRLYFLCYDNYVYALKARSGNLLLRVRLTHRLSQDAWVGPETLYLSPYTSARLLALTLPELQLVGEYRLDLEGEWFTTPPVRAGDRLVIGYGRYEGRILALKEEPEKEARDGEPPPSPAP